MKEKINSELSIYLKMMRVKHNLSQEEMANRLSVARNTYSIWESNPIKLDLNQLMTIGDAMEENLLIFFKQYVAKSN